jgi:hypothetical protein
MHEIFEYVPVFYRYKTHMCYGGICAAVGLCLGTKIVGVSHWRRASCLASRRRGPYITEACGLTVGLLTVFGGVQVWLGRVLNSSGLI